MSDIRALVRSERALPGCETALDFSFAESRASKT